MQNVVLFVITLAALVITNIVLVVSESVNGTVGNGGSFNLILAILIFSFHQLVFVIQ